MARRKIRYTVSDGKMMLILEPVEEGGYLVTSPIDPDILTQAETVEEAFEKARDVIALFAEVREGKRSAPRANHKTTPRRKKTRV